MNLINAKLAVHKYGQSLIGNVVQTARYGDWPGGLCTITEIEPDPNAPEIVFQVKHVTLNEEIGVFDHEEVGLFPDGIGSTLKAT